MASTSWRSLFVMAALVAVTKVTTSTWRDAFSAPPRNLVGRGAQTAKTPVMEVEIDPLLKNGGLNKTTDIADVAQKEEREKRERVAAKTAKTKKRVEEKKKRLQAETKSEGQSEQPLIDWKGLATQSKKMAKDARNEAASTKDEVESFTAEAKETFFQLAAVGLETASGVPPLILAASAGFLTLVLVLSLGNSKPPTVNTPSRATSPTIVTVKSPPPVLPSAPEIAQAPEAKLANEPPAPPAPPAPVLKSTPSPWARGFANSAANTLRSIADGLPGAEQAVEDELPVVQSAFQWASGLNSDNATQKVENDVLPAVGKAAEGAIRLGLQVGASGLEFVGQNLPAANEALGKVVDAGMPYAQSALHDAAANARRLAVEGISVGDASNPYLQGAASSVPEILKATAGALDATADMAPAVKSAVGYAANAATPVAQALLSAASDLARDTSEIPASTVEGGVANVIETAKAVAPDVANSAKQALSAAIQVSKTPEVTTGASS